jgi:hypothetical protein
MTSKNVGSARKGKAVEQLVASIAVLATGGELNALTALVDDEGVDLSFKRRNGTRTHDVQVKARFSDAGGSRALREKGNFGSDVREETFRPRPDLWMLYVAVDGANGSIDWVWLVPSEALDAEGIRIQARGKNLVRFAASAKDATEDKWRMYRYGPNEWPGQLLEVVAQLEPDLPEGDGEETEPCQPHSSRLAQLTLSPRRWYHRPLARSA